MSCLRTDPAERPASAAALREALAELEVAARRGPDSHARLRHFVSERLGRPPNAAGPASGQRLAGLLIEMAREPEETTHATAPTTPAARVASRPRSRAWPAVGLAVLLAGGVAAAILAATVRQPASEPVADRAARPAARPDLGADRPSQDRAQPDAARPDLAAPTADLGERTRPRSKAARKPVRRPVGAPGGIWVMSRWEGRLQWGEVFLDGRRMGQTPIHLEQVAAGDHMLEIKRRGFRSESRRVTVVSGAESRVFFELRPEP
jgi:hypothetical protein